MAWSPSDSFLDSWSGGEAPNPNIGAHYASNDPLGRTAFGGWGITTPTWNGLAANHPELGLTADNRTDPAVNRKAFGVLSVDNANALQAAGITPTDSSVRVAGMFGPSTASKLLTADPNMPVEQAIQNAEPDMAGKILAGNPWLKGKSVGEALSYVDKTHGGDGNVALGAGNSISGLGSATPASGITPLSLPAMPSLPDAPTARGPSPVAQAEQAPDGSTAMQVGLAMMGGAPTRTGFSAAADAYNNVLARQQALNLHNADLSNDGINRDWEEPYKVFDAKAKIADLAFKGRGQDATMLDANQRNQTALQEAKYRTDYLQQTQQDRLLQSQGPGQRVVVPGALNPDGSITPDQKFIIQPRRDGSRTILDGSTMQPVDGNKLPDGYRSEDEYNRELAANRAMNDKQITSFANQSTAARAQDDRFNSALTAFNNPNNNNQAGIIGNLGRALDAATGLNITGNLSDQAISDAMLKQDMLGQFGKAGGGGQRVTDALRGMITSAQPHTGMPPEAVNAVTNFLKQQNQMPIRINQAWNDLGKTKEGLQQQDYIRNRGNFAQWVDQQRMALGQKDAADLSDAAAELKKRYPGLGGSGAPAPGAPGAPTRDWTKYGSPPPASLTPAPVL